MGMQRGLRTTLTAVLLTASAAPLVAQDAVPASPPAPEATTPALVAPLTPRELVGKSVEDLRSGGIAPALKDDITALRRGPLLIHGNYCGIGNRPGTAPVDVLDEACKRHDACTRTGTLPPCACDDRLRLAATTIAADTAETPDLRALAGATAAAMAVLICK